MKQMSEIASEGFSFSIDDFGTGYSKPIPLPEYLVWHNSHKAAEASSQQT
jgi:sensor c-di-GMP phosphodiesterase-like protein